MKLLSSSFVRGGVGRKLTDADYHRMRAAREVTAASTASTREAEDAHLGLALQHELAAYLSAMRVKKKEPLPAIADALQQAFSVDRMDGAIGR